MKHLLAIADLTRLEIHGPAEELEKLKAPLAHLTGDDRGRHLGHRLEGLRRRAGADQVAIAVGVVDSTHRRPVFVLEVARWEAADSDRVSVRPVCERIAGL